MERIYLDNGSTSFPKAPGVAEAMYDYVKNCGCNVSRGGYDEAYRAEELVLDTRQRLTRLFHGPDCRNVVFTRNITESLNVLMKGLLHSGDHVLVSSMEHNAVMRPLRQMEAAGVMFDRVPCNPDGTMRLSEAEALVRENTKLFVCLHASNVCGTLLPIKEIGTFCKRHQIRFFLDSAQTAGVFPIDMQTCHIDAVAFTGHKGLLGPQGTGGIVLREELAQELTPWCGRLAVFIIPFTEIQEEIRRKCPEDHFTLIMRRFMMRLANMLALELRCRALVTGENLGQVASQTMQALAVSEDVTTMPVLRPLIGMDKEEIVKIARHIGTFDTSILPYEDCCTVFTPRHPKTKPSVEETREYESALDVEGLCQRAMAGREMIRIKPTL